MDFKDELLNLKVGDEGISLKDYKLTDEELKLIKDKIIEQVRVAIEDQDLRLDLNSDIWDWVRELDNQEVVTVFTERGHEWELMHGRIHSTVRWLNPQRDEQRQQKYYNPTISNTKPNRVGVVGCTETWNPMTPEEALAWADECVNDDELIREWGIPVKSTNEVR